MKFYQNWIGYANEDKAEFAAKVPGNIQSDYWKSKTDEDIYYADNTVRLEKTEGWTWYYLCKPEYKLDEGERVFFVSKGIDYKYDIILNGETVFSGEGMFSDIELDLTEKLKEENEFKVKIYPHPKSANSFVRDRSEADESAKPAVCYGWDWHPRLLVSGMWQEAYFETRNNDYIDKVKLSYTLSDDFSSAEVCFDVPDGTKIEFSDAGGNILYCGEDKSFCIKNPHLWWCNGQGEPYLYSWRVTRKSFEASGKTGFRRVRLVMNEGAWDELKAYPMTRNSPPITVELNGRRIFAKGSNFVNPEIFNGEANYDEYKPLVAYAKECNMNIFRCWGGAVVPKECFYDLCDEYGIMVWQEFPLACNEYKDKPRYLSVLEKEAVSIIEKVKGHPCHILWCGGNELFNNWSLMTDQSKPLRLLNSLCYKHDENKPFIMTAPLMGMAHGPYNFIVPGSGKTIIEVMNAARHTAYTEFGVRSLDDYESAGEYIPSDELSEVRKTPAYINHQADLDDNGAYDCGLSSVFCTDGMTLEEKCRLSIMLQREGLKNVFEAARRQKPYCSMAINWCYNEPWPNFTNCNIIRYPNIRKDSYFGVKESLKPIVFSAEIERFSYFCGENLHFGLWLLNDSQDAAAASAKVYFGINGEKTLLLEWNAGNDKPNENLKGPEINFVIPYTGAEVAEIIIESEKGYGNKYIIKLNRKPERIETRELNQLAE